MNSNTKKSSFQSQREIKDNNESKVDLETKDNRNIKIVPKNQENKVATQTSGIKAFLSSKKGIIILSVIGTIVIGSVVVAVVATKASSGKETENNTSDESTTDQVIKDSIESIEPENDCPKDTPFYCQVGNELKCVESQLECDCPPRYIMCDYMKYCVPENRKDMCLNISGISEDMCPIFEGKKLYLNKDGICRISEDLLPTQIVCPIGSVLCADLTCRDSYEDCPISDYCEEGKIRCVDQSWAVNHGRCTSTIICPFNNYVCINRTCVDSKDECNALPNCPEDKPYRCPYSNDCAENKDSCWENIACGHSFSYCDDFICRQNCSFVPDD